MFKRTGMPSELKIIDFDGKDAVEAKCPKCKHTIGRICQGMLRSAGSNAVVKSGSRQVCPKCGGECNV